MPGEQGDEMMMMGLRLSEGVSLSRHARVSGAALSPARINALVEDGLLTQESDIIRTTRQGRLVLDALLVRLLA